MSHRRLAVLPLVVTAATALLPAAPAASAAGSTCTPKGSRTVVANPVARVYTTAGGQRLFGCLRSARRPFLIVDRDPAADPYVTRTYARVTLSGRFVGWSGTSTDSSCKADCPPGYDATREFVSVTDLGLRRARFVDATATTTAVAVSTSGSLAWTQGAAGQGELHLSRSGAADTLVATGRITEVSFQNAYLLWRAGGQATWIRG